MHKALNNILKTYGKAAVALSGGVDSACLLREAVQSLGRGRVLAVTADSCFFPRHEMRMAEQVAGMLGVALVVVNLKPLALEEVRRNDFMRCYYCKRAMFAAVMQAAGERGFNIVFDGGNTDDKADYRPGMRALRELGVKSPFIEAGIGKEKIRELSEGLPTRYIPANACLATRIPYDTIITPEALKRVEAVESSLRELGFTMVRARYYGDMVRIETPQQRIEEAVAMRGQITAAGVKAGFRYVSLDLEGYKPGNMNSLISEKTTKTVGYQ